tara:strand:- start:636 stop:890 length:255 start_codon:yes stop_codon:yes gene_type:complete
MNTQIVERIDLDKDGNEVLNLVRRFYFRYNRFKTEETLERQFKIIFERIEKIYGYKDSFKIDTSYTNTDFIDDKATLRLETNYV